MSERRACAVALALVAGLAGYALAQEGEPAKTLIPGKGSQLVTARCATCHDAQHITRARLSRGEWEDNIRNMRERGAPMEDREVPIILDYLATYYNRDAPAPAPDPAAASFGMEASAGIDPVARLLTANACVACHTLEKPVVGPSFQEIAAKYTGDGEAAVRLARKVKEGGAGVWGNVPMPPNAAISDADVSQIVGWILQQR